MRSLVRASVDILRCQGLGLAFGSWVRRDGALSRPICCGRRLRIDRFTDNCCGVIEPDVLPQPERNRQRIELDPFPPCRLVTMPVQLAMMDTTHGNSELVADLAAQCPRLCKPEMVGIGGGAAAHHAGLGGNEFAVVLVAQADGLGDHAGTAGRLGIAY